MKFSIWDYIFAGALVPLSLIILLLFLATATSMKLTRKNASEWIRIVPICIWLMVTLGAMSLFAKGMEYPLTAWIQADYPMYITTGQITDIADAPAPPVYGLSLQPAKLLTINGETFYALAVDMEEGAYVRVEWSTDARIVYALECINRDDTTADNQIFVQADMEGSEEHPIGKWILGISIVLFLLALILQYPLGKAMAPIMIKKDKKVTTSVIPNRYGLFHYGIIFCLQCCVILGMHLTGFRGIGIIFIIALPIVTYILVCKQTIKVTLQQDILVYKELLSELKIPLTHIDSVEWGRSGIPYIRQLIIRLKAGRAIILQQEHCWGLESLFNQLRGRGVGSVVTFQEPK